MGIDQNESRRQRAVDKPKRTVHPYAAIEHRVIDSEAYADLTFSARALLVLFARQLTKDNNGHLHATYRYLKERGFDSEHTVSRAIGDLIAHGMIYRTRSGGFHQGAAQYAVTWLPITNKVGLFLHGFKSCAWRDWKPENKKTRPPKMQLASCKNGIWTPPTTAQNAASPPPKSADNELMPCSGDVEGVNASCVVTDARPAGAAWMTGYLSRLEERGLAGHQCFQIPETLQ
jgi:hypothetical protein